MCSLLKVFTAYAIMQYFVCKEKYWSSSCKKVFFHYYVCSFIAQLHWFLSKKSFVITPFVHITWENRNWKEETNDWFHFSITNSFLLSHPWPFQLYWTMKAIIAKWNFYSLSNFKGKRSWHTNMTSKRTEKKSFVSQKS